MGFGERELYIPKHLCVWQPHLVSVPLNHGKTWKPCLHSSIVLRMKQLKFSFCTRDVLVFKRTLERFKICDVNVFEINQVFTNVLGSMKSSKAYCFHSSATFPHPSAALVHGNTDSPLNK